MGGHIRRRGKHSWELKFDIDRDATGERETRYRSFKGTRRQAELELARLISQHAAGEGVDPSKETIADFARRWDRDWLSINLSPKSIERYRELLRLYVVPRIGAMPVQKLRAATLAELYAALLRGGGKGGRPLAPATVSFVHRILHRMIGHAVTWGIVSTNVTESVEAPPTPDTEIAVLSEDQIRRLMQHLNGRTLRPIVSFLLGTGCRRGEALALQWKDIDFKKATVRIERSVEETKGGLRIKSPKTRHGRRNVSISPWLVAELRAHHLRQQEQRLKLGMGKAPEDSVVFARWDGGLRSPHSLTQKFAETMMALGFDATMHVLRHSHVSQLIAAGLDVLTISRRIGHASPSITLDVYGHMFKNTDTKAAEIIEAAFACMRTE